MKKLLAFLLIIISSKGFAQGFGNASFKINYSPGLSLMQIVIPPLLVHHRLEGEYIINKNYTVALNLAYLKKTQKNTSSDFNFNVEDFMIGVQFKNYRKEKGASAPIGRYVALGINLGFQNKVLTNVIDGSQTGSFIYYTSDNEKSPFFHLNFRHGRDFIISKSIVMGYGVDYGIMIASGPIQHTLRHTLKPIITVGYNF